MSRNPDISEERKMEEGVSNGHHHDGGVSSMDENMLNRLRSTASVTMSPEMFEKLYLSPPTQVKGELRKTFGNPTPIALVGFLLSLTPLSCDLMGWRGAGGNGAASVGAYYFMGGLLMVLGGILEWVLGNSFASVVFCTFGGFWLSFGGTLTPSFAAFASYAPGSPDNPYAGLATPGFNASLAFWLLFMGLVSLIFFVCAFRTNIVFVVIFLSLTLAFGLLAGGFWALAADFAGNAALANRCIVGAGASTFVTSMAGWYLLLAIMLAIVDFPFGLPVGDLSSVIKGRSARLKRRA